MRLDGYSFCLVSEAEGGFSAYVLEFDGCFSQGETIEEAYTNLRGAAEAWVAAMVDLGRPVPKPLDSGAQAQRFVSDHRRDFPLNG